MMARMKAEGSPTDPKAGGGATKKTRGPGAGTAMEHQPKLLAEKILHLTWSRGWSVRRLAKEFPDASSSTVNRWTTGVDVPDAGQIRRLCDIFNVSADFLVRDEVDDHHGGAITERQRYLLGLIKTIGDEESERRLLLVPGSEEAPPAGMVTRPRSARE